LFGHLTKKDEVKVPVMDVPATVITWEKFSRTVLPTAERMEALAPLLGNYCALLTAADMDAPPILQWDSQEQRNPVSWYVHSNGATAASFNVPAHEWVEVEAITLQPSGWNGGFEHQGNSASFILRGARELSKSGIGLFPEFLKTEFHGVRRVLEAYSRGAEVEGYGEPAAAGLRLESARKSTPVNVRVWTRGHSFRYQIDRWD
jgi:hypothetical protein